MVLAGGNCIKIGLPGKSILGEYFHENRTSRRPFLLLRISFPGKPIFIQLVPADDDDGAVGVARAQLLDQLPASLAAPAEHQRDQVRCVAESGT